MKIRPATTDDEKILLTLMRESHDQVADSTHEEWAKTERAARLLLIDPQAGEAYLTVDDGGNAIGYIVMCRGFSLDYGGYFTWVEETFMRQSDQGRFRDERFSP
jgi:hypothetical protein